MFSSVSGEGSSIVETFSVQHAESVYVVTAVNDQSGQACSRVDASRTYYELPLNYQFDASFTDDSLTSELALVDEAIAKSKLVFGWVENPDNAAEHSLSYGFLGYSYELRKLELLDRDGSPIWTQARELASYPSIEADGVSSPFYLFDVQALGDYQYLVQLNQDIFVVDASTELFAKTQGDIDSILADRVLKVGTYTPHRTETPDAGVYKVEAYHDDDDLLIIDGGKIFTYPYLRNRFVPDNAAHEYQLLLREGPTYDEVAHRSKPTFSQFDYQPCPTTEVGCVAAHDTEATTWQFITDCEEVFACELDTSLDDLCETQAELDVTQSGRDVCSPEFFQHLGELNGTDNDAEFVGFMQYLEDSINNYQVSVFDNSLLISASMLEKDVIVRYFYKQALTAPKSVREQILFGAESDLYALDHFVENDNLFINALMPVGVRSNECYKGYRRVACDLGSQEDGEPDFCTGKDLDAGLCFNSYTEFESTALFCTPNQVLTLACTDAGLASGGLQAEEDDEDAKWVRILDLSGEERDKQSMLLLKSSHAEALEAEVLDEGRLLNPVLFEVEDGDGSPGQELGVLTGTVETVIGGVLFQHTNSGEVAFDGQLDIISSDISTEDDGGAFGSGLFSTLAKYAIVNTLSDENSAVSVRRTPKLTDSVFGRLKTAPKSLGSDSE